MLVGSIVVGILTGLVSALCALIAGFGFLAILSVYSIGGLIGTILTIVWTLAPIDGSHVTTPAKQRSCNVRLAARTGPIPD